MEGLGDFLLGVGHVPALDIRLESLAGRLEQPSEITLLQTQEKVALGVSHVHLVHIVEPVAHGVSDDFEALLFELLDNIARARVVHPDINLADVEDYRESFVRF